MANLNFKKSLINILGVDFRYPKGSYYETFLPNLPDGITDPANITDTHLATLGDDWFNPNFAWGGTWVLETEGQVHVSAGTNYIVNGAPTNTSDGGESTHALSLEEMPAHNHNSRALSGSHRTMSNNSSGSGIVSISNPSIDRAYPSKGSAMGAVTFTVDATHTHDTQGSGTAHNNMQPYIVVYRWFRTA